MRLGIFNAALLAGWFLLTLGGILLSPGAGLLICGIALVCLTVFIALRYGVYEERSPAAAAERPDDGSADPTGRTGHAIKLDSYRGR